MATIYLLRCSQNNKVLISYSSYGTNFKKLTGALSRNVCTNKSLQEDWNKFGEQSFKLEVLEECWFAHRIERRQYYMNEFMSTDPTYGYNIERKYVKKDRG